MRIGIAITINSMIITVSITVMADLMSQFSISNSNDDISNGEKKTMIMIPIMIAVK